MSGNGNGIEVELKACAVCGDVASGEERRRETPRGTVLEWIHPSGITTLWRSCRRCPVQGRRPIYRLTERNPDASRSTPGRYLEEQG